MICSIFPPIQHHVMMQLIELDLVSTHLLCEHLPSRPIDEGQEIVAQFLMVGACISEGVATSEVCLLDYVASELTKLWIRRARGELIEWRFTAGLFTEGTGVRIDGCKDFLLFAAEVSSSLLDVGVRQSLDARSAVSKAGRRENLA
jgi:hypothetical protein